MYLILYSFFGGDWIIIYLFRNNKNAMKNYYLIFALF